MVAHQDKTKYMIIGTRQKLSRCEDCSLTLLLNNKNLQKCENEKLLGIHIDSNMTWSKQVEELRKKLLKRIAAFNRIKDFLHFKYRILLFNASIKPLLEYCVTVWGNCSTSQLDILFKLQKRCARMILNKDFKTRSLELFKKLGWSPIDKICVANIS